MFASKKYVDDEATAIMHYVSMVESDLFEDQDNLWEALSELSALVEFLVEKQEGTKKPAKAAKVASPKRTTKKA